ncbi:hypothetical protein MPTK1_1g26430 [Marchantia polymorpha subsp. ruderalis]|uniref:Uncharacterized protein n=2 Tax=Marchantia polymorpha TaxID=3197 RepID=A0AAF6AUI3_MARPO|nr:hypothetical protein MARPO_0002s0235 [Marchantia polymorpha]BBN00104.1 hypothetical protein Mp_1g26430 [Marchantia polymorpha subsp. ruderalis]|eukprot:PTQ49781.1 hypothetical protein MARPO_0002s0235 [Marchantia polymorpha]
MCRCHFWVMIIRTSWRPSFEESQFQCYVRTIELRLSCIGLHFQAHNRIFLGPIILDTSHIVKTYFGLQTWLLLTITFCPGDSSPLDSIVKT